MKILPQNKKDEFGQKYPATWYHLRMTPNERLLKLKALYKQFAEIVKIQTSYYHGEKSEGKDFPEALIDELTLLESMPREELMALAISDQYRKRYTGKTLDEEIKRYTISFDVLNTSRWRDYEWQISTGDEPAGILKIKKFPSPAGRPVSQGGAETPRAKAQESTATSSSSQSEPQNEAVNTPPVLQTLTTQYPTGIDDSLVDYEVDTSDQEWVETDHTAVREQEEEGEQADEEQSLLT